MPSKPACPTQNTSASLRVSAPALVLMILIAFPAIASAYIDPGNGSYLFQILIGFALTALVTLRATWTRTYAFLKSFLSRLFGR